jgi:hypothetical protein
VEVSIRSFIFLVKYLSYNGGYLYAMRSQEIDILFIEAAFSEEGTDVDGETCKRRQIPTTLKIQGAPMSKYQFNDKYQMIVFETPDNQLEFDKIILKNFTNDETFTYTYEQIREAVPREKLNDPIVRTFYTFSQTFNFSVALRKSGGLDLYWNMQRKETVEGCKFFHLTF